MKPQKKIKDLLKQGLSKKRVKNSGDSKNVKRSGIPMARKRF